MSSPSEAPHGRGAAGNPPNRFASVSLERDLDWDPTADPAPTTEFLADHSQTVITYNDSPDVGFTASLNPYRGCEHGCAYCYARPYHEYLGFSAGLDFETKIMVKTDAPELLRRELSAPGWKPQTLGLSGVTDPYQPVERRLELTRRCLEVLVECRNPVGIVTKNNLVTRDVDLLQELARCHAAAVNLSVTTLDSDLARRLEPRTSSPRQRLAAITTLAEAGVPVGVLVAPVLPALTDHEIPRILQAAAEAGAKWAGTQVLRLPHAVAPLFEQWLEREAPGKKDQVLNRVRALRGGHLNDYRFGSRMRGEGFFAEQIQRLFHIGCRKAGLTAEWPELSTAAFRRLAGRQLELPGI
jgi:DNA repair photolyase